jgi:Asp-tRNA(Asn)/Glu-tRNA(Gln) amidotransferase A subunit family amidase
VPAINVPLGLVTPSEKAAGVDSINPAKDSAETKKLPIGCQVIGPEFSEARVYKLAFEIEQLVKPQK